MPPLARKPVVMGLASTSTVLEICGGVDSRLRLSKYLSLVIDEPGHIDLVAVKGSAAHVALGQFVGILIQYVALQGAVAVVAANTLHEGLGRDVFPSFPTELQVVRALGPAQVIEDLVGVE